MYQKIMNGNDTRSEKQRQCTTLLKTINKKHQIVTEDACTGDFLGLDAKDVYLRGTLNTGSLDLEGVLGVACG